jgi:nitroreductase
MEMNTLDTIHTRRSIRKYEDRPLSAEVVQKLLAAAMQAPSARNQQPWQFVVIDERPLLGQIGQMLSNARMAQQAPLAILICGDLHEETSPGYWVVDCAAAAENMLLAAHALGLGAVWTGVYPREERMATLSQLIGVPSHVIPHSLIVVGYAAEEVPPQDRYRPERVRQNHW